MRRRRIVVRSSKHGHWRGSVREERDQDDPASAPADVSAHLSSIRSCAPRCSSSSTDKSPISEAKGEDYGTNIWTRTYRGSSSERSP
jgi:hypothetical protein